jgi:hypothetical protein
MTIGLMEIISEVFERTWSTPNYFLFDLNASINGNIRIWPDVPVQPNSIICILGISEEKFEPGVGAY